jgi:putative endonuclease
MFYVVYVLQCKNSNGESNFYIGYTLDLEERMKRHLRKEVFTTKKFDTITLVYYEACLNEYDARSRELQLKTGFGRGYIKRRLTNYLKKRD